MPDSSARTSALPEFVALRAPGPWQTVFQGSARDALEAALPHFMAPRRWFGSKARAIRQVRIVETIPLLPNASLALLEVDFVEGEGETYALPTGFIPGAAAETLAEERPADVIAKLQAGEEPGILYDAVRDPAFCQALLETIVEGRRYGGLSGDLVASASQLLPRLRGEASEPLPPVLLGVEQSNTSVRYGERLILKLYRRLAVGANPDQEIGQFLTEKTAFANTPPLAGVLEFRRREPAGAEPITVALLQGFVPNQGDAWRYTLDSLDAYFANVREQGLNGPAAVPPQTPLFELIREEVPAEVERNIGPYVESARLLARRTAELHLALASVPGDPAFAPVPFSTAFQAYLHQSMRDLVDRIMHLLRARFEDLSEADQKRAREVLALEEQIRAAFDSLLKGPIHAMRARIHGDYHLGQVLYTGDDFMIIDFEGEPARPLSERKMKRSPLQDVAGMLRSFHYAAYAAYFALAQDGAPEPELEDWARYWRGWVSAAYLKTYLEVADGAPFIPGSAEQLKLLLDAYLVEKAVYELGYELNNRPSWARIPLQGILQTVQAG